MGDGNAHPHAVDARQRNSLRLDRCVELAYRSLPEKRPGPVGAPKYTLTLTPQIKT